MLLEHGVGVDAAKAEAVDTGPAGVSGRLPRAGLGDRAEAGPGHRWVRVLTVQRGWQGLVVDGQSRLYEPRHPRRGHGMADHGLHRTERHRAEAAAASTARGPGPEHLGQGGQLCRVASWGGRAVGLDQPDGGGIQPGGLPCPAHGQHLSGDVGAHDRGLAAVTGYADTPDHGVDPVVVALRVGLALEDHHPGSLADQQAVCGA